MILHIIQPCKSRCWLEESGCKTTCYVKRQHVRGQQLFHPSVLLRHVDRRSSRLLPHTSSVREFVGGEGGLNCEVNLQVLVVMYPPLFPGSRSQKGGGGVTTGQYGTYLIIYSTFTCWSSVAKWTT